MRLTVDEVVEKFLHGNGTNQRLVLEHMRDVKKPIMFADIANVIKAKSRQITHVTINGLIDKGFIEKCSVSIEGVKFDGYYRFTRVIKV